MVVKPFQMWYKSNVLVDFLSPSGDKAAQPIYMGFLIPRRVSLFLSREITSFINEKPIFSGRSAKQFIYLPRLCTDGDIFVVDWTSSFKIRDDSGVRLQYSFIEEFL